MMLAECQWAGQLSRYFSLRPALFVSSCAFQHISTWSFSGSGTGGSLCLLLELTFCDVRIQFFIIQTPGKSSKDKHAQCRQAFLYMLTLLWVLYVQPGLKEREREAFSSLSGLGEGDFWNYMRVHALTKYASRSDFGFHQFIFNSDPSYCVSICLFNSLQIFPHKKTQNNPPPNI